MVRERVWRSARRDGGTAGYTRSTFQAMSTHCQVKIQAADARLVAEFQNEALDWVAWFEAKYSRFIGRQPDQPDQRRCRRALGGD